LDALRQRELLYLSPHSSPRATVLWKISTDGRPLLGKQNQMLCFQPVSVPRPQAAGMSVTFAVANVCEKNPAQLQQFLLHSQANYLLTVISHSRTGDAQHDYRFVADWCSLECVLGFDKANARLPAAKQCPHCHISRAAMRRGHFADPCAPYLIDPNRPLPKCLLPESLSASKVLYCYMHGFARLLCWVLSGLFNAAAAVSQQKFLNLVHKHSATFLQPRASGAVKVAMRCEESKRLMEDTVTLNQLSALFLSGSRLARLCYPADARLHRQLQRLDASATARLVLNAVRVYFLFGRLRWPAPDAFRQLALARSILCAFFAVNQLSIMPSVHWMLNHAVHLLTNMEQHTGGEMS
jgi:hypothetical protein